MTTTNCFWTSQPLLITENNINDHRARFLAAEKSAPVETMILSDFQKPPDFLIKVNPDRRYPILIDKHLVAYGHALDELFHERYPSPALLDTQPVTRAQQRVIAKHLTHCYQIECLDTIQRTLLELDSIVSNQRYLFSNDFTVVDVAAAPFLWHYKLYVTSPALKRYANRLFNRPAFTKSLTAQQPVFDTTDLDDVDAEELLEVS